MSRLEPDRFHIEASLFAPDNFNNASMGRIGASFIFSLDDSRKWSAEVGYNQWVWGKSARQYDERFLAFGRRF